MNSIFRRTPLRPALSEFRLWEILPDCTRFTNLLQFYRQICKLSQGFEFTEDDLQRLLRQNAKRKEKTRKGGELTVLSNSNVQFQSVVTIRLKHHSLTPFSTPVLTGLGSLSSTCAEELWVEIEFDTISKNCLFAHESRQPCWWSKTKAFLSSGC